MPPNTVNQKISTDLFALTYGSIASQLLADFDDVEEVNKQLERMGYNIGLRIIEDYLAKSSTPKCRDLRDVADKIQHAFQMYLNITPGVDHWSQANDEFSIILYNNPLTEFVELPDSLQNIDYLNILPGVIRGALEMVSIPVRAWIKSDHLKGDIETEIRIKSLSQ